MSLSQHLLQVLKPATVSSFDPNTVTNKLFWLRQGVGMLDGSGNTVTANGTTVATWQDQTGNGNHFTGSGTYLDATGAGLGTGKGAISSDGSTNSFGRGSMTLTSNFTLFLVQKVTSDPNLIFRGSNGAYAVVSQNGSSVASDSLGATSSIIRLDGSPTSIATRGGVYTYTNNRFRLITFQATGSNFNGSTAVYFWDYGGFRAAGKFCEIFWVNKVVTGTELDDVENYFLTQYGIARTDPYFSNVSLLLHMDSTFADSSSNALTVTATNATISTAQGKFGGASGYFNGSAYITATSSGFNISSGNFTIEFWIRFNATGAGQQPVSIYSGSSLCMAFYTSANNLNYYLSSNGSSWNIASGVSAGAIAANTWYHVALVRNGNTFTPYVNGVAGTSTTSASNLNAQTTFYAGVSPGLTSGWFTGYIDDIRVTPSVARTITVPTAPFPNS